MHHLVKDFEREEPPQLTTSQLRWMQGVEVLGALYERASRGPARTRLFLAVAVARGLGESRVQLKFPRTLAAVSVVRGVMPWLAPRVASSTPVVGWLARSLSDRPVATHVLLDRWCTVVRMTRWVHRVEWELSLRDAVLEAVDLEAVHSSMWDGAGFEGAALMDIRVRGSVRKAVFDGAVLRNVSFVGAAIEESSWRTAVLEDVIVAASSLERSRLDRAVLQDCTFTRVDLTDSRFDGASMTRVVFEHCDLTGVDLTSVAIEDVDFVACMGVDTGCGAQRTAVGAIPRDLAPTSNGPRLTITRRYADAMTRSSPPVGYRMQTLLRSVTLWIALGDKYEKARQEFEEHSPQTVDLVLPRSRLWGALHILFAPDRRDGTDLIVGPVYEKVCQAVRASHPEVEADGRGLPELVCVDGDRPRAELVIAEDHQYLLVSGGLIAMAIRLARYCVGWILPAAISFMDNWPEDHSVAGMRSALATNLEMFAKSGHDVSGLPRLQVTGMRDMQATSLMMTFLAFVLAHEVAHALQAHGTVLLAEMPIADRELAADVFACRLVAGENELDGDAEMLEAIREMHGGQAQRAFRSVQAAMRIRGVRMPEAAETTASVDASSEESLGAMARFTNSSWHAAAITVFLLALGGPSAMARVRVAVGTTFDEQLLEKILVETESEDMVLGMVRRAFA
jgi:hypothetical protein